MPIAAAVIGAGASIFGGMTAAKSNKEAAQIATAGQVESARLQTEFGREAQEKQLAFAREGQEYLKGYREEERPGLNRLNEMIADEGHLTPAQQLALEDLRRSVRNQVSTSSLSGSGRTAAALFKRAETDFTLDALDRNRARGDTAAHAAGARAGTYATGIGNISVGTGTQQAALSERIGQAQGTAASNAGIIGGNAAAATGKVWGETMGNVGGIIAAEARKTKFSDLGL